MKKHNWTYDRSGEGVLEGKGSLPLVLLGTKYAGAKWTYGKVWFEELGNGSCKLHFDFNIIEEPKRGKITDAKFHKILGDILVEILDSNLSEENSELGIVRFND